MSKLILSVLLLLISICLNANTLNVRQDGLGNYTTIQAAINASVNGDVVLVHPGTYLENIDFIGKNITVASLKFTTDDPVFIGTTIIDGQRLGSCVKAMSGETSARIVGFSITNGSGVHYFYADEGGGILVGQHSTLSIESCRVYKNETEMGGGLYARLATIYLSDTSFFDNHGITGGGGICLEGDEVSFTMDPVNRCNIYNNYSSQGADILSWDLPMTVNVVVDTFTVINPDRYFAQTQVNFYDDVYLYNFDIQHTFLTPINHDFYVSTSGDDHNDGLSPVSPYKTIAWALHNIASDSLNPKVVHLANGIYSTSTNQQKLPIGIKSYVNIEGESQENTIIDGDNYYSMLAISRDIHTCHFKNMKLTNFTYPGYRSAIIGGYTTDLIFENITIENCTTRVSPAITLDYIGTSNFKNIIVSNNVGTEGISGVSVLSVHNVSIENCAFLNNQSYGLDDFGWYQGAALRVDAHNFVSVRSCVFQNNNDNTQFGGAACVFAGFDFDTPATRIENCLFTNNQSTYSNIQYIGRPIHFAGHGSYDIINCTFANNESPSATVEICAETVNFWNCIFADNSQNEMFLLHPFEPNLPGNHVTINHCNVKGGINSIINEDGWGTIDWQEGNIDEIPLFNYSNPDKPYELMIGSPCIDTGTSDVPGGLYPFDLNGAPRIYGNGVDMGCYEYGSVDNDDNTTPTADVSNISIYPNPFRDNVKIEFVLPVPDDITIMIYNIRGQLVKTLTAGKMSAGPIQLNWDGKNDDGKSAASGEYFCLVDMPGHSYTKKMMRIH
jgi:hypothetical protein